MRRLVIYAPELMEFVYMLLLELTSALAVDGLDIALETTAALTFGFSIMELFRELLAVFMGEARVFAAIDPLLLLSLSIID